MSENAESAEGTPVEPGPGCGRGLRSCAVGVLVLASIALGGLGFVSHSAGAALDARLAQAEDDLDALVERSAGRRATILAEPDNDENALPYYNAIEWVVRGGKLADQHERWRAQRPELPADIEQVVSEIAPQGSLDLDELRPLQRGVFPNQPLGELDPEEAQARAKAEQLYAQYKPLLRYVRRGLSRGRCDWEVEFERGPLYELPSPIAHRVILILMIHEAAQQPPSAGVRTGLEMLALSQDLNRRHDFGGTTMATWAVTYGLQSLAHSLSRAGLSAADCRLVQGALAKLPALHVESFFDAEVLAWEILGLSAGGRRLQQSPPDLVGGLGPPGHLAYDFVCLRELEGYRSFMARSLELTRLPLAERRGLFKEQFSRQAASPFQFVSAATPLGKAQLRLDELLGMTRALQVLVVARLRQLEGKLLPARIEDLSEELGGALTDPCASARGVPLRFVVEGQTLRAWSVGGNSSDEGGPARLVKGKLTGQTDDRGFTLRIPGE